MGSSPTPGRAFLGLGSNLGAREENLRRALLLLSERVEIVKLSSVYESEPVGFKEQPWFLNLVCEIRTRLSPRDLLRFAKEIERKLGRKPSFPNAPRPIDIDILFFGDLVLKTEDLVIPHPRLHERAFVLLPLSEIAPDLVHPELGLKIKELLELLMRRGGERCTRYGSGDILMPPTS